MWRTLLYSSTLYSFIISLFLVKIAKSLPDDICNDAFNKSDCNVKPTPVFAYYKPGSRCEIEIWRGCPTFNKFENEYVCSHHCIGRLTFDDYDSPEPPSSPAQSVDMSSAEIITLPDSSELTDGKETEYAVPDKEDNEYCTSFFNGNSCSPDVTTVYTFNRIVCECEETKWGGCPTKNKFDEVSSCLKVCNRNHCLETMKLKKTVEKMSLIEEKSVHKLVHDVPDPEVLKKDEIASTGQTEETAKAVTDANKPETKEPAAPSSVKLPGTSELKTVSPLLPQEVEVDYK